MRITIFEYSDGGHRLTYVRQVLAALHGQPGLAVAVAVSSGAADSEAFKHQLEPWKDRFPIHIVSGGYKPSPTRLDMLKLAGMKLSALKEAIRLTNPDCLVLPTADGVAQLLACRPGLLRGIERIELVMHGAPFAHPPANRREAIIARTSIALAGRVPRSRLHFVNALGWDHLHDHNHRFATRSDVLPDPVDALPTRDKHAARQRLGLPPDDTLIVSGGVQNRRKGIDKLLLAMRQLPEHTLARTRLVLAGRSDADIASTINTLPPNITERLIRIDRYLSDEELADALSAGDLVATCHPRHMGLSNIALRAVSLDRPVLASNWGWLGAMVPRFDLGWAGPIDDPSAYARTIADAIEAAPAWQPSPAARRLIAFHHPDNFKANILGWFGIGDGGTTWQQVRAAASV